MIFVGVAAVCVAGWVTRPLIALRRRGTLDEQRLAAIREETRRLRAARDLAPVTPLPDLPGPRRDPDRDAPTRATSA